MRFANSTRVPAGRSREEIEKLLTRYGALGFVYGNDANKAIIMFQANHRRVKFLLPLPDRNDYSNTISGGKQFDQAVRQAWRILTLVIKAKLEAVESGLMDFETEFLSHICLPTGGTVAEWMKPQIATVYQTQRMPPLLPGA